MLLLTEGCGWRRNELAALSRDAGRQLIKPAIIDLDTFRRNYPGYDSTPAILIAEPDRAPDTADIAELKEENEAKRIEEQRRIAEKRKAAAEDRKFSPSDIISEFREMRRDLFDSNDPKDVAALKDLEHEFRDLPQWREE